MEVSFNAWLGWGWSQDHESYVRDKNHPGCEKSYVRSTPFHPCLFWKPWLTWLRKYSKRERRMLVYFNALGWEWSQDRESYVRDKDHSECEKSYVRSTPFHPCLLWNLLLTNSEDNPKITSHTSGIGIIRVWKVIRQINPFSLCLL